MSFSEFPLSKGDRLFLENRLKTDTFPQTLLIEGGTEDLRHALALFLSNALVCTGMGARPCGACRACVKCKAHSHPDIKLYAPEKKNSIFKVEVCREIRQDAFIVPNDGMNKVYILEDSQNMNDSSENALLKILEEPPAGVYFILTCNSRTAMLPTILSRAAAVTLLGTQADHGEETLQAALEIANAVAAPSELTLLKASAGLRQEREEIRNVLLCLCDIFEDALKRKSGGRGDKQFDSAGKTLSAKLTKSKLYALYSAAQTLLASAEHNANTNLLLISLCYVLRRAAENK